MLAVLYYRGAIRASFLIENIRKVPASSQEEAGQVLSISGRGGMTLLDRAIVWSDGTTATTRTYTAQTKAAIMISLITEAQARGGLSTLTYDFTATDDSDSVAWTDSEDYDLTVGTTLLDVLRQFAKTGIEFEMNYSGSGFVLSAYKNGIGTDRSQTVFFRIGTNCQEIDIDQRGNDIKNALLVAYQEGNVALTDATSITANGRREELIDARLAQSSASAVTYGAALLSTKKDTLIGRTIKVYDGIPPYLFINYILGDTVTLDIDGVETSDRVLGIQCDFDGYEYSNIVIELNALMLEQNLKMRQDVDYLINQWQTAHDGKLIEVSYWAAIGDANTTYNVKKFVIIGDDLYMINNNAYVTKYGLKTGVWSVVFSGILLSLAAIGTDLYIGGIGSLYRYDTLTGTSVLYTTVFTAAPLSNGVYALAVDGTTLYVSGLFDTIDGVTAGCIAKYNSLTSTFSAMADEASFLIPSLSNNPILLFSNGLLYSVSTTQAQAWNGTTWSNIGAAFGGNVYALTEYGTGLLAGANAAGGIFVWDSAAWATFGGGVNGAVRAIGVYLTDVYIGGSFTDAGNYVSRYSGGAWWQLESGVNALVDALILNGQDLYVGGDFTDASGKPAQGIAAYFNNFESLADYLENSSSSFDMGAAIHAAAASAITDTDEVPFWEATANALRKITWANIKATLKTYFDTLYVSITGASWIDLTDGGATTLHTHAGGGSPGGSDTQIQFNDAGAFGGDANLIWDAVNSAIQIGGTNWYSALLYGGIHITKENGGNFVPMIVGHSYGDGTGDFTNVPTMGADRAGGTVATPTAVLDNMGLVRFNGGGYDGTALSGTRAQMLLAAAGNWSATSHPTKIEFWTTPVSSVTRRVVGTLGEDGNFNILAGKTYNVNGSPHTHTAAEVGAIPNDGWVATSWASLTRTSATVFTTTTNVSGIISKGMKLKITDTTTKYLVVVSAVWGGATTTITTLANADYALVGNPSAAFYSNAQSPFGWPGSFNFTCTTTASTGTFTSVTTNSAKYEVIGNKIVYGIKVTITTAGTAANAVYLSLPTTNDGFWSGSGREDALTGKMLQVYATNTETRIRVFNYDNTTVIASGAIFYAAITAGW
jgi:hypothetical protein